MLKKLPLTVAFNQHNIIGSVDIAETDLETFGRDCDWMIEFARDGQGNIMEASAIIRQNRSKPAIDIARLRDELTNGFIFREYALMFGPMLPDFNDAMARYTTDYTFHSRVQTAVAGVMTIVQKYMEDTK